MTIDLSVLITSMAEEHGLQPALVHALVAQESAGNPYAWRPEPRYRYFVNCKTGKPFRAVSPDEISSKLAPPDFPYFAGGREQEWWAQQASLGLMQVMGAVAREQGFRGPYLTELCEAHVNLQIGCKVLASNLKWSGGNVSLALGAYNAGRGNARGTVGQAYAAKVLARMT